MGDLWECVLTLELRADLTDAELAELRWHVGDGPQPASFAIVTDHFMTEVDGRLEIAPEPLLAESGAAYRIGGEVHATLTPRAGVAGWALDVRQEVHSESLDNLRTLVDRLARHADGAGPVGYLRFYEEDDRSPMVLRDGEITCADL